MKLKHSITKYTVICTICILTVSVFALLMIYNPFNDTSAPLSAPAANEEQAISEMTDESQSTSAEAESNADKESPATGEIRQINIYVTNGDYDFYQIIEEYAKEHWNFSYKLNLYIDSLYLSTPDVISMVNNSLINGDGTVDIYRLPAGYSPYYIKGVYSGYVCTYKELGIDVEAALKNAGIPECAVEAGLNPDGELIALPYLAEPSVFLYSRSVAKDIWGTDDPDKIAEIIGGGTQKWDKFIEAAKTLKKHGCYIVPGFTDLSFMLNHPHLIASDMKLGDSCFIEVATYCLHKLDFGSSQP